MNSKFFFLDNGDDLYDEIITKTPYGNFYESEIDLIRGQNRRIAKYIKSFYI
jgi:hypothetical protein